MRARLMKKNEVLMEAISPNRDLYVAALYNITTDYVDLTCYPLYRDDNDRLVYIPDMPIEIRYLMIENMPAAMCCLEEIMREHLNYDYYNKRSVYIKDTLYWEDDGHCVTLYNPEGNIKKPKKDILYKRCTCKEFI
mgnify:CR=1 FL=1